MRLPRKRSVESRAISPPRRYRRNTPSPPSNGKRLTCPRPAAASTVQPVPAKSAAVTASASAVRTWPERWFFSQNIYPGKVSGMDRADSFGLKEMRGKRQRPRDGRSVAQSHRGRTGMALTFKPGLRCQKVLRAASPGIRHALWIFIVTHSAGLTTRSISRINFKGNLSFSNQAPKSDPQARRRAGASGRVRRAGPSRWNSGSGVESGALHPDSDSPRATVRTHRR